MRILLRLVYHVCLITFISSEGLNAQQVQKLKLLSDSNDAIDSLSFEASNGSFIERKDDSTYIAYFPQNEVNDLIDISLKGQKTRHMLFANCPEKVLIKKDVSDYFSFKSVLFYVKVNKGEFVLFGYNFKTKSEKVLYKTGIFKNGSFIFTYLGQNSERAFFRLNGILFSVDGEAISKFDDNNQQYLFSQYVCDAGLLYSYSNGDLNFYLRKNNGELATVSKAKANPLINFLKRKNYETGTYSLFAQFEGYYKLNSDFTIKDTLLMVPKPVNLIPLGESGDTTYFMNPVTGLAAPYDSLFLYKVLNKGIAEKVFLLRGNVAWNDSRRRDYMIVAGKDSAVFFIDSYPYQYGYSVSYKTGKTRLLETIVRNLATSASTLSSYVQAPFFLNTRANKGSDGKTIYQTFAWFADENGKIVHKALYPDNNYFTNNYFYNYSEKKLYVGYLKNDSIAYKKYDNLFFEEEAFRIKKNTLNSQEEVLFAQSKYTVLRKGETFLCLSGTGVKSVFKSGSSDLQLIRFMGEFGNEHLYFGKKGNENVIVALDIYGKLLNTYINPDYNSSQTPAVVNIFKNGLIQNDFIFFKSGSTTEAILVDGQTKQSKARISMPLNYASASPFAFINNGVILISTVAGPQPRKFFDLNFSAATCSLKMENITWAYLHEKGFFYKNAQGTWDYNSITDKTSQIELPAFISAVKGENSWLLQLNDGNYIYYSVTDQKVYNVTPKPSFKETIIAVADSYFFGKNKIGEVYDGEPNSKTDTSYALIKIALDGDRVKSTLIDFEKENFSLPTIYPNYRYYGGSPFLADEENDKIYYHKLNISNCREEFYSYDCNSQNPSVLLAVSSPDSIRYFQPMFKSGNRIYTQAKGINVGIEYYYFNTNSDEDSGVVTSLFQALKENSGKGMLYPNPVITSFVYATGSKDILNYTIMNVTGEIVKEGSMISGEETDIKELKSGFYIINIGDSEKAQKMSFIKY